jgi:hypothetical protein
MAMKSSSRLGCKTSANIDNMMERLGIDAGYRVVPRFGLFFCLLGTGQNFTMVARSVREQI